MVRVRVAALRARHIRLGPKLPPAVESTAVLHPADMSIPGTVLAFSVTPAFGGIGKPLSGFQAHPLAVGPRPAGDSKDGPKRTAGPCSSSTGCTAE